MGLWRSVRGWGAWAVVLALVAAVVGCGAGGVGELLPRGGLLPWGGAGDRIAYVGNEGDLYTVRPDGSDPRRLTQRGGPESAEERSAHFWPTWSPDGRSIATSRVDLRKGASWDAGLYVVPAEGGEPVRVFAAEGALPFFYGWSPDGRMLSVLSREADRLALRLVRPDGSSRAEGEPFATGNPVYSVWSPDSTALAAHVGGSVQDSPLARVVVLPIRTGGGSRAPVKPDGFHAPAFSPDGRTLFAGADLGQGKHALVAWPIGERATRTLHELRAIPQFVLSPRGDRIALTREENSGSGRRENVEVVDLATGTTTELYKGPVVACLWSPDGSRLAWVAIDRSTYERVWFVGDGRGEPVRVAPFRPTEAFAATLQFFDQYASTVSLWSPDSRALLFAGWTGAAEGPSRIWVVEAAAGATPRAVGEGTVASWSPGGG